MLLVLVYLLSFPKVIQAYATSSWNTQVVDLNGSGGFIAIDSCNKPHIAYYVDPPTIKPEAD